MITYSDTKIFPMEDLQRLFLSVGWESGNYPDKLVRAMRNSTHVVSAWDGNRLIGLVRALDDGETVAFLHCKVFSEYAVDFCYLFGSYAKGNATDRSDVDLLISTKTTGLRYYEMVERLREALHKKVDLLDVKQLMSNEDLLKEVLKEGIRIH